MSLILEIFAFLTVLLRGATLAAQALVLGGLIFEAALAGPLAATMGHGHERTLATVGRFLRGSCWALAALHVLGAFGKAAVLRQATDLSWAETLGATFVVVSLAAAAAAIAIAVIHARANTRPWLTLAALAAIAVVGTTATSHAAARLEMREVLLAAVVLHQLGAAAWIGGLPYFLFALNRCPEPEATRAIGRRYSQISMVAVSALFAGGLFMSLAYVDSTAALHGTAYGAMLTTKVLLFGGLLLLGFANYRLVERLRANPATPSLRLKRFAEVEMGTGLALFFVAASLTSIPPSIDLPNDRLTMAEIVERMAPRWPPRFTSPDLAELSNRTIAEKAIRAESVQRSTTAAPVLEGATQVTPDTYADAAWSEFNHNWAGAFVLLIGILALAERTGRAPWAKHWPLVFLALAVFLFIRSDPENWPLGENSFFASFFDPEVAQHRIIIILVIAFAGFEWAVRTGRLTNPRAAHVFPILTAVGGSFLLAHSHAVGNFKEELLIELSHLPIGTLGIIGGWSRWLELRHEGPEQVWASWLWRWCFVVIGFILLFYREV
jgi:putative copper resistance protein D